MAVSGTATIHVDVPIKEMQEYMADTYFPSRPVLSDVKASPTSATSTASTGKNEGLSMWRFQLEPAGAGTTVTFTVTMPNTNGLGSLLVRGKIKKTAASAVATLKTEAEAARRTS
jgi:hypothetical protein